MASIHHDVRTVSAEIAVVSDPGRDPDKQVNEDSCAHLETALGSLVVVCDGMGGHAGGREASQLAIETIAQVMRAAPPMTPPAAALKRALEEANARIWEMPTAEAGYRPGSTAVAALIHSGGIEVAHAGDSRLYLVHEGAISQVTSDHSVVQEMVSRNLIRAEDAASHPLANKILRALGIEKEVEVEVRATAMPYVAGDVLVLCSDGLSDLVLPSEILSLCQGAPRAAAHQLVELANARGGHDNITAMVVRLTQASAPTSASPVQKTVVLEPLPPQPAATPRSTQLGIVVPPPSQPTPVSVARPLPMTVPLPLLPAPFRPKARLVLLGVGLAAIALALLVAFLLTVSRPKHRSVPVVDDDKSVPAAASSRLEDDESTPALTVSPAPPLEAPSPTEAAVDAGHRRHRKGSW
jgi:serine/threonine protein phosphatase PrpC